MKKIHMNKRVIVFLVIVQYCLTIGYASDEAGCSHNGTMFADGSLVPSMEPCLSCKCFNSHLICSLRVCAEQPIPPPRGCILVHKMSSCCPHLSCKKYHNNNNENNNRKVITYNSHWYNNDADLNSDIDERQKVISKNSLYRRIDDEEIEGNDQMCVHNGSIYRTGSAMSTSSLCSYCYCIGGKQKCIRPKCLLASPGCEPVFIDSACCPIRYNCGPSAIHSKDPLKTSNFLHYVDNKHYNRMRSRSQRSRGCLVGSNHYPEGEKLPIDALKPCDICFCIQGERKCTPKKCAPYIGSCKPMIPAGQCCPSNYECDHSVASFSSRSSHISRQFDLFSYFFGDESAGNETNIEPNEHEPLSYSPESTSSISSTSEKSLFDAIREGLNYIDSNDEHVEKILEAPGFNSSTTERPLPNDTNKISILDIFLGDDSDDDNDDYDDDQNETSIIFSQSHGPEGHPTYYVHSEHPSIYDSVTSVSEHDRYALINEHSAAQGSTIAPYTTDSLKYYDSTTSIHDFSNSEKIVHEFDQFPHSTGFDALTLSTIKDVEVSTFTESTTEPYLTISMDGNESANTFDEENDDSWLSTAPTFSYQESEPSETTTASINLSTETNRFEGTTNTQITNSYNAFDHNEIIKINATTDDSISLTFFDEFPTLFGKKNATKDIATNSLKEIQPNTTTTSPSTTIHLELMKNVNVTRVTTEMPPIPKTTRKINPTIISFPSYPLKVSSTQPTLTTFTTTTISPQTTTTSPIITHITDISKQHQTSPKIILMTTNQPNKPTLIDSNPSILESDLNYDYGEPTLPPSLPNLKIIPFLPTDAVQKDNVKPKFDYFQTSFPVLTENYENRFLNNGNKNQNSDFGAFEDSEAQYKEAFHRNNANSEFSSYDVESKDYSKEPIFSLTNVKSPDYDGYPSITEGHSQPDIKKTIINKYPAYSKYGTDYDYDSFDPAKHLDTDKYVPGSYEVISGHEYSIQGRNPSFDKYTTDFPVYHKIDFSTSNPLFRFNGNNQFSPPSKTEGGFLPKEPMQDDQYYDIFHTTKFNVDMTTENSPKTNLSGLFIGITSENPFKDVIRTEPSPNLLTLIEDKEKLLHKIPEVLNTDIDHDYPSIHLSDIEKEIISITTDTNYDSTPDAYEFFSSHSDSSASITLNTTEHDKAVHNISPKYSTEISVSSVSKLKPTTIEPEKNDFFGSLLGYIFKDNLNESGKPHETIQKSETSTIPPFKKISSTSLTLMDILNFTRPIENSSKNSDVPQRKNNKIYEYPTTPPMSEETQTPKVENLLRDVLLATLNSPSNIDSTKNIENHPTIDVPKQIYSSHSIHQFLNPIFSGNTELSHVTNKYAPIRSEIDLSIPKLNSQFGDNKDELINNVFGPESYQVLNDYPSISNSRPFGENPIDYDSLKEQSIYTKPLNSFPNSMGILKLAGCNIYGRMYRVGRIITELSNPCLECKCTEVGVHCTPLNC